MSHSVVQKIDGYPQSGLSLFWALFSGVCRPGEIWDNTKFRLKFLLRTLINPVVTLRYLQCVSTDSLLRHAALAQNTLPAKIHRPYLFAALPVAARARAILEHYTFIKTLSCLPLRQALTVPAATRLCVLVGKNGEQLEIKLSMSRFEREGEATLTIHGDKGRLASLTFSIVRYQEKQTLFIGGLQGASRNTSHTVIKEATKACHGLFPKRLLVEMLQLINGDIKAQQIIAVGDKSHVFQSARYRSSKQNVFFAHYDEFWASVEGLPMAGGLYALPQRITRKSIDDLPSKKRAEYRRRYALLEDMRAQFEAFIHSQSGMTALARPDAAEVRLAS